MFEIGIFCVIFLAVAYWVVLWLMGRRQDVLNGEFDESEPHAEEPVRLGFPKRPVRSAPSEDSAEPRGCDIRRSGGMAESLLALSSSIATTGGEIITTTVSQIVS